MVLVAFKADELSIDQGVLNASVSKHFHNVKEVFSLGDRCPLAREFTGD
jgi:hypothetical protein